MPFGAVGGKETYAVAGLYAEFNKGGRQASDATEKFLGRDASQRPSRRTICARGFGRLSMAFKKREGSVP